MLYILLSQIFPLSRKKIRFFAKYIEIYRFFIHLIPQNNFLQISSIRAILYLTMSSPIDRKRLVADTTNKLKWSEAMGK
jgi:hypothetical protein